jgi:hypothetical protein
MLQAETLEDRRMLAQTVGLFTNAPGATDGYTLFAPSLTHRTYLIDNLGNQVHAWPSDYDPGNSVYLNPDGSLWRTGSLGLSNVWPWTAAGVGGIVQKIDWDGRVVASFRLEEGTGTGGADARVLHHDIEVLPNGNVAMIAFDYMSENRALENGRAQTLIDAADENDTHLIPDSIIEVAFNKQGRGTIVWEWHVEDHFVQDRFPNKLNYAGAGKTVADFPEKIDINYVHPNVGPQADLTHANGLEYIEELDQFILSVRSYSEIWVIDHNTVWDPANGINEPAGPKGDLLYRWGNPAAYGGGEQSDQQSFFQHDALWVPTDSPEVALPGSMTLYNNGHANPTVGRQYSTVSNITPPIVYNPDGSFSHYALTPDLYTPGVAAWGPAVPGDDWIELAEFPTPATSPLKSDDEIHFSPIISGAQRLDDGNTLVTEGVTGTIFQVTPENDVVWEYVSPIVPGGRVRQGDEVPLVDFFPPRLNTHTNFIFKARHYDRSYLQNITPPQWGDTAALFDPADSYWYLNNRSDGSIHDLIMFQGEQAHSAFTPIAGDWDGDGIDTVGLYDNDTNTWYLNNSDSSWDSEAVIVLQGDAVHPSLRPIAGDWDGPDGDGLTMDMPGLYDWRTNTWHLYTNYDVADPTVFQASVSTFSGPNHRQRSWLPIAGDWDADGVDGIGLYVPSSNIWYLNNRLDGSFNPNNVDASIGRGPQHNSPGWRPIAGDWNLDGVDNIGLYVPGSNIWYMNNKNDGSVNDLIAFRGPDVPTTWRPIVGNWNGSQAAGAPAAGEGEAKPFFQQANQGIDSGILDISGTELGKAVLPAGPLDANLDGHVAPADALVVFNLLNQFGSSGDYGSLQVYPDTSGDMLVSPIDALMVINYLNGRSGSALGEGESAASSFPRGLDLLREGPLQSSVGGRSLAVLPSVQEVNEGLLSLPLADEAWQVDARIEPLTEGGLAQDAPAADGDGNLEQILDQLVDDIATTWNS